MDPDLPVVAPPEVSPAAAAPSRPNRWKWLSNQNPFYLFSAACVLHSTGWNFDRDHSLPAWLTPLLIAGYIALMALAGGVIVRLWKVWDDARTIFVTLLILFLELALSLDQFAIHRPTWGLLAILGGWAFAVLVSESLLLGLGMRLPTLYRTSFHLQLGLLFGYPLLLVPGTQLAANELTTTLILLFAAVIALPLLMLWPAVRRGPDAVTPNGTPWSWPCYPWTLPTVLSLVLVGRAYTLCLTYDAAPALTAAQAYDQFASIFGGYFAVPTLLAAGLLILESGIVRPNRLWRGVGLALPAVALLASLSWNERNAAADALLARITQTIGSPVWLTLLAAIAFYLVASLRGVRTAPRCLAVAIALTTIIRPPTLAPPDLSPPPTWVWIAAASATFALALWHRRSRWALEACLYATAAAIASGLLVATVHNALAVLFVLVTVTAVAFDDRVARELREFCLAIIGLAALCYAVTAVFPQPLWWKLPSSLAGLTLLAGLLWSIRRVDGAHVVFGYVAALTYGSTFLQGSYALNAAVDWAGLPAFSTGLGLLHLGVAVSAWKGYARRRASTAPPPITTTPVPA